MSDTSSPDKPNRRIGDDWMLRLEHGQEALRQEVHALTIKVTEASATVEGWRGSHEHILNDMQHMLHRHDTILHGKDGDTGLVVKVDRHDSTLKVVVWAGGLLVLSSLGFAGWITQQAFAKVFMR